jgi:transposase
MLALALILQAYMGISDDEVIEATLMDRRWQLVLDCLDSEQAPWSQRHAGGFSEASHRGADGSTAHRTNH